VSSEPGANNVQLRPRLQSHRGGPGGVERAGQAGIQGAPAHAPARLRLCAGLEGTIRERCRLTSAIATFSTQFGILSCRRRASRIFGGNERHGGAFGCYLINAVTKRTSSQIFARRGDSCQARSMDWFERLTGFVKRATTTPARNSRSRVANCNR
jgi:hypothetical protein